jgi:F-type H+-transporting ATPase subunit a
MHEHSEVALFLNRHLFEPIARALGRHPAEGHPAVPDHIVMILLIALGLIGFAAWARRSFSVENPTRAQHLLEAVLEALQGLMREVIGGATNRFLPLIGTLAIYIFLSNVLGMIPGFLSPTSNLNVTVSCALCVFLYYNYQGIRRHGVVNYLKHFAGPVWWLAWLLFPVEIISHMARPFSLSMRLFGNIFAEELITGSLNRYIFPFLASLPVMFLGLFASTIQAFIFVLLTMVYISGAVEGAHEHEEEHGSGAHADASHPQAHAAAA